MTEASAVNFTNYRVGIDPVAAIGATESRPGVVEEIKTAFDFTGGGLDALIGHVAPHKTLQDNIAFAAKTLSDPAAQARLGYEQGETTAVEIARDWGERSDLQAAVLRPFMSPASEEAAAERFDVALVTDGVVNWMNRMGDVAVRVAGETPVVRLLLASAEREIGGTEHPDVPAGTKANSYMGGVLLPRLIEADVFAVHELTATGKRDGNSVMARAAMHLLATEEVDLSQATILVPAVAGNWPQKGAQARQAIQEVAPEFDTSSEHRQLWVASDHFPLGITGEEPKATHQNPFSAIGNILRGAKLLAEQSA